jgi:hypothetical protein
MLRGRVVAVEDADMETAVFGVEYEDDTDRYEERLKLQELLPLLC